MPYLVRKINRAKWESTNPETEDFAADAITVCLRTSNNELSFWRLNNPEEKEELERIIVAITSAGHNTDTIDIAIIDESSISNYCEIVDTIGSTAMEEMRNRHCDIVQLTYSKLGKVAELIYYEVKNKKSIRLTSKSIKELILAAIEKKEIQAEKLHSEMRQSLKIA